MNEKSQNAEKLYNIGEIGSATFITYADGKKIKRALTKPPFRAEVFIGREADLSAIQEKLFSGDNLLLLVNGKGGVGKTTIAAKYYETQQHGYAHCAWVLSERSIATALVTHLAVPLDVSFAQDATVDERLDILLTEMANLNKPCLLVIDNANELEDLQQNYQHLRRCSNFHILLTSRINNFRQAAFHPIEGLPEPEARKLFEKYYQTLTDGDQPIFSGIYHAVGGNTLVIEVLAKNLFLFNQLKQHYSLAALLQDLQTRGVLALSQSQAVEVDYHMYQKASPEAIIAAMYDLSELSRAEIALLSVFAVLPAESIGFAWLERLLPETPELEKTALALAQRGWIDFEAAGGSFKCNPVVQEITRKKNAQLQEDCAALVKSLNSTLDRDVIHLDNYAQAATAAGYGESILNTLTTPAWNLNFLCDRMGYYYQQVGNLMGALSVYERQRNLIEKLGATTAGDADLKYSLAITLSWLGITHTSLGNLDKALGFYEDYFKSTKELYESYPDNIAYKRELAISYEKLGNTHKSLGNLDKALGFYEDYIKLTKELYESYPDNVSFKNSLAISYSKLGNTHTSLGNLDKALGFYEDYFNLRKELFESYPNNVSYKNGLAISYSKLGNTHNSLGNLDKALGFYEDYFKLSKELYKSYPNNVSFKNCLAVSYAKLGEFSRDNLKDNTQARIYFLQAEELWIALVRDAPQFVEFQRSLGIVQGILKDL